MLDFIILGLYMVTGLALIPTFARESYKKQRAMWSIIHTEHESRAYAACFAWLKSIVWPIFAIQSFAIHAMTSEERSKSNLDEEERKIALAERRMALAQAQVEAEKNLESLTWIKTFNEFDKQAKKS